ncbi:MULTISPECIES: type III-B CRISPR-associated protein Cas10/Cmr2 [Nostocales]|uniref:CRISPR-associated protein Crm2 n=3 Tax=Nostocales TaxID=1161 RepID=A0A0C1N4S2_9CYAN|nr:type III-B CRISPR-associated protein Cas10/Cmr2 [Tolypothrix bouteillei]KAF3889080.1 type III-B CRISPR-associated protein Cas10/Cmr2 [Tolypothrix bouteillei VB521301]
MTNDSRTRTVSAFAWCLAWGKKHKLSQDELSAMKKMRQTLIDERKDESARKQVIPDTMQHFVMLAEQLYNIDEDYKPETLSELEQKYQDLWKEDTPIGLVYGGATKIKQYVFEAAKLHEIRGASALLDRINLEDVPGFFGEGRRSIRMQEWLRNNGFADLVPALIPELIIYSTGGSVLAFCPAALVDKLANAIEKRYTDETLTANSCAVGDTFRLLEFRFGLLQNPIEKTLWLGEYKQKHNDRIIQAYFDQSDEHDLNIKFWQRKNFNELVGKLANQFTHRRNGNLTPSVVLTHSDASDGDTNRNSRPSRCYPPMFETHPYLQRDETERRAAVAETNLPGRPNFSAALARKVIVGQRSKNDTVQRRAWYKREYFGVRLSSGKEKLWNPGYFSSWVTRFQNSLQELDKECQNKYYQPADGNPVTEALSLREIGNVSKVKGFVGYIYADGNNMGGYIRNRIRTPQDYRIFSQQVLNATQKAVYIALKKHLQPRQLQNLTDSDISDRNKQWIYPFEIITIGGDDVLLIVPADKALDVAKTLSEEFENQLPDFQLEVSYDSKKVHRYQGTKLPKCDRQCELSMSAGVLITAESTPIYYGESLTNQLLKSSKKLAKDLKREYKYYGGTVDFLALKAVTMIASTIKDFREQGLTKENLKFYAAPYTLYELEGLLETVAALKKAKFPKSQLYQIRSLLERGRRTAILNYRYFRVRLQQKEQVHLKTMFEETWCQAKSNNGNLAPWMSKNSNGSTTEPEKTIYETIWRDLVDLHPFVAIQEESELPNLNPEPEEIQGVEQ